VVFFFFLLLTLTALLIHTIRPTIGLRTRIQRSHAMPMILWARFYSSQKDHESHLKTESPIEKAIRDAKENKLSEKETEPTKGAKPSLSVRVKKELMHYWQGSKLLGKEISISYRLVKKLLYGTSLSRREQRQLKRTTGDMLRLVPFIVILAIPFLEFALPVLLKFFPNMLPSTFESKFQEEEKKKRLLQVRLQVAKFLQETVTEMSVAGTSTSSAGKEFGDFLLKYRTSGEQAPIDEMVKICKKFQDELTLSSLSRPQLVSMARYMNINAFGTDSFLRQQIENRLKYLKADDKVILATIDDLAS
jgi:LETM1 and EF-hand domain-containing protein 1